MSWILACINFDIIDLVISFTTTAHELWTWIHTLYEPISLPPVNGTIQREVARGRSMVEKTLSGFNPSENQKSDKPNQTQDLKENSKILNKCTGNLLGVTDSTTTTIHAKLKDENIEKKGLNSNERNREINKKNEGQKILGKIVATTGVQTVVAEIQTANLEKPLIVEN